MVYPSTRAIRPSKEMYREMAEIRVGSDENYKVFNVHKGILSFYSGFFDRALNGRFAESGGLITLPEEDIDVFERFVLWLCSGHIEDGEVGDSQSEDTGEDKTFEALCKLWTFADRREIPLLANECINAFRDKIVALWEVPTSELEWIYNHTTEGAGLRRFALQVIAHTLDKRVLVDGVFEDMGNKDILRDLLCVVWANGPREKWTKSQLAAMSLCEYHQHEPGVICEGGKK